MQNNTREKKVETIPMMSQCLGVSEHSYEAMLSINAYWPFRDSYVEKTVLNLGFNSCSSLPPDIAPAVKPYSEDLSCAFPIELLSRHAGACLRS